MQTVYTKTLNLFAHRTNEFNRGDQSCTLATMVNNLPLCSRKPRESETHPWVEYQEGGKELTKVERQEIFDRLTSQARF